MNVYRTLRIYGNKTSETQYSVLVNDKIINNGEDELYSFTTNVNLHSSNSIVIKVVRGEITLTNCTATYPALYNNSIEGTVTIEQPIAEPVAVILNNEINTIPFNITIKQGEQFEYEHLMFNGPSRYKITVDNNIKLYPGINVYAGNFLKEKITQGILDAQVEFHYDNLPVNLKSQEDLENLKSIVINKYKNLP